MKSTVAIILNYCDWKKTARLVKQFIDDCFFDYIVVVDNFSNDDSIENLMKIDNDKFILIKNDRNNGFASGNNIGIRYAYKYLNPKYLCVIGADILVDRHVLVDCRDVLIENKDIALVSPKMLNYKGEIDCDFSWKFQTYFQCLSFNTYLTRKMFSFKKYIKDNGEDLLETDVIRGSFMFFNATLLSLNDYFDENTFLFYEENIICKKIKKLGFRIVVLANNTYIHDHVIVDSRSKFKYIESMKSAYYYLVNYCKIGFLKRLLFKFTSLLGRIEYNLFSWIKKRRCKK